MRIIRVLCVTIIASLLMTACGSSNAEEKIIEDVSGLDNYISGDNGQYVYVTLMIKCLFLILLFQTRKEVSRSV